MTGVLAPAKTTLQLLARQLHDRGTAVHIVRRQVGGEELQQELAHLLLRERLARLHRGAAGERRREALQAISPPAEAAPREIGNHLSETRAGIEARVRRRHRVENDSPPAEGVDVESDAAQLLPVRLDRVELLVGELERKREEHALADRIGTS